MKHGVSEERLSYVCLQSPLGVFPRLLVSGDAELSDRHVQK